MKKENLSVVFDHQIFSMQKYGGISNSFARLYQEFNIRDYGINARIGAIFSNCAHLHEHLSEGRFFRYPRKRYISETTFAVNRLYSQLLGRNAGIIHPTFYLERDLPEQRSGRVVSTVHDMTPEILPAYFPQGNVHQQKRRFCDISERIVCVSENTRNDLIRIYGVERARTRVVYHGIDMAGEVEEGMISLPSQYGVFVGSRRGYKNFPLVVEGMARLLRRFPELHLLCVGGGPLSIDEKLLLQEHNLSRKVLQTEANDRELRGLYRKAAFFIFPSLYEGFGIPILEAMAQECPVVLARSSCFPEIAQDAATYFEPSEPDSCANAIERVLSENNASRIHNGSARCRDFTWEKAAREYAEIYRELVPLWQQ